MRQCLVALVQSLVFNRIGPFLPSALLTGGERVRPRPGLSRRTGEILGAGPFQQQRTFCLCCCLDSGPATNRSDRTSDRVWGIVSRLGRADEHGRITASDASGPPEGRGGVGRALPQDLHMLQLQLRWGVSVSSGRTVAAGYRKSVGVAREQGKSEHLGRRLRRFRWRTVCARLLGD